MKTWTSAARVGEVLAGEPAEDLEDPHRARRLAGSVFGVERDLREVSSGHGSSDLEFDEGMNEQGDEVARHEPLNARRVTEEHRGDELVAFELGVAPLKARLVLVGGEDGGDGCRLLIGDERSEERRVGEEGRSRWSAYHLKKKKKSKENSHSLGVADRSPDHGRGATHAC